MIEIVTGILSLNLEYRTPAKFIKNNLILCHANEMLMPNSNLSIFDKDRFEFFIIILNIHNGYLQHGLVEEHRHKFTM